MKLLLTGDFCQHDRLFSIFDEGNYDSCFNDVKSLFSQADYSVVNLETPIVEDVYSQIPHKINLRANESIIGALQFLNINCCALANNHMRDYLDYGLANTLRLLDCNGFDYLGAGFNNNQKRKIKYIENSQIKVALLNYCEHEFSVSSSNAAGCNPIDPIDVFSDIQQARNSADYIVVIVHGGHEHYNLPSPSMKKLYHFLIDSGADVIVNHHQHCYSGYEEYNGGVIFYGLGNFCFDWPGRRDKPWNYGYVVELNITDKLEYRLVPYCQMNDKPSIQLLKGEKESIFFDNISQLNKVIKDDAVIDSKFRSYCLRLKKSVMLNLSIYSNHYAMGLAARGILPLFTGEKRCLRLLNYFECESHRDVVLNILNSYETF